MGFRSGPGCGRPVSIRAPAKGAIGTVWSWAYLQGCFNPRPREGSDLRLRVAPRWSNVFQSAPPRRERWAMCRTQRLRWGCFNPRPREGSDLPTVGNIIIFIVFQSAPPRRERSQTGLDGITNRVFQSAPPRRERFTISPTLEPRLNVSIRAPAKGAIWDWRGGCHDRTGFNPRPREGSDMCGLVTPAMPIRFQSAPPRRER